MGDAKARASASPINTFTTFTHCSVLLKNILHVGLAAFR
jgi:hypothetical protein